MDKYQKYIFQEYGIKEDTFIFSCCRPIESVGSSDSAKYAHFDKDTDTFQLKQDEDITKTKYVIKIPSLANNIMPFSNIAVKKKGIWEDIPFKDNQYSLNLDFNDITEEIKFVFKHHIADDYVLKVSYKEANAEVYYIKQEKLRKEQLLKKADIKISTGSDLVNIYFQPCSDKYDHTEISLFIPKDYKKVGGPRGPVNTPDSWSMIKKCTVDKDDFYKTINGLAYGTYSIIVKQYGNNNIALLVTEHIEFKIKKPDYDDDLAFWCV